ncbi:MAG: DotU family type IV/VI secretion system protein [Maricaulaceae bacterium]
MSPAAPHLIDLFRPVLRDAMAVIGRLNAGEQAAVGPADRVAQRLQTHLQTLRRDAVERHGRDPKDVDMAVYAVVALVDDIFPQFRDWWRGEEPIQLRMFSTRAAGDQFFERCDAFAEQQQELREVYLTAIGLGFRGRLHEHREPELARRARSEREQHTSLLAARLDRPPIAAAAVQGRGQTAVPITPQPFEIDPPAPLAPPATSKFPWLLWALIGLAMLTLMGGFAVWWFTRPAETVSPEDTTAVARLVERADCAVLKWSQRGDRVTLQGFAPGDVVDGLRTDLQALDEVERVRSQVTDTPRPFCEAFTEFAALGVDFFAEPAPTLRLGPEPPPYKIDALFTVDAYSPEDLGDALSVIYVHPEYISPMAPSTREPDLELGADRRIRLGVASEEELVGDVVGWRTTPPAGSGFIIAFASDTPLVSMDLFDRDFSYEAVFDALAPSFEAHDGPIAAGVIDLVIED